MPKVSLRAEDVKYVRLVVQGCAGACARAIVFFSPLLVKRVPEPEFPFICSSKLMRSSIMRVGHRPSFCTFVRLRILKCPGYGKCASTVAAFEHVYRTVRVQHKCSRMP